MGCYTYLFLHIHNTYMLMINKLINQLFKTNNSNITCTNLYNF